MPNFTEEEIREFAKMSPAKRAQAIQFWQSQGEQVLFNGEPMPEETYQVTGALNLPSMSKPPVNMQAPGGQGSPLMQVADLLNKKPSYKSNMQAVRERDPQAIDKMVDYGTSAMGGLATAGPMGAAVGLGSNVLSDLLGANSPKSLSAANLSKFIPGIKSASQAKQLIMSMLQRGGESAAVAAIDKSGSPLQAGLTGGALPAVTRAAQNTAAKVLAPKIARTGIPKELEKYAMGPQSSPTKLAAATNNVANAAKNLVQKEIDPATLNKNYKMDARALTPKDQTILKKVWQDGGDAVHDHILDPVFNAKSYKDLPTASKTLQERLNLLKNFPGDFKEEFNEGLKRKFIDKVLTPDNLDKGGAMLNPDSFKARLDALGKPTVDAILGKGGYDQFTKMSETASRLGVLGKMRVAISKNGFDFKRLDEDIKPDSGGALTAVGAMVAPGTTTAAKVINGGQLGFDRLMNLMPNHEELGRLLDEAKKNPALAKQLELKIAQLLDGSGTN